MDAYFRRRTKGIVKKREGVKYSAQTAARWRRPPRRTVLREGVRGGGGGGDAPSYNTTTPPSTPLSPSPSPPPRKPFTREHVYNKVKKPKREKWKQTPHKVGRGRVVRGNGGGGWRARDMCGRGMHTYSSLGDGEEQLELGRQLLLAVQPVREVQPAHTAVRVHLHAQRLDVVGAVRPAVCGVVWCGVRGTCGDEGKHTSS